MNENRFQTQIDRHRQRDGKFGTWAVDEVDPTQVVLTENDNVMPGLEPDQAAEWRSLDSKVQRAGFSGDSLSGAELARYEFYSEIVDAAVRNGERGWMPTCPVHENESDSAGGTGPDSWGNDITCRVCRTEDGSLATVNRIGIKDKVDKDWVTRKFDDHASGLGEAADFFRSRGRSSSKTPNPQAKYVDVDVTR